MYDLVKDSDQKMERRGSEQPRSNKVARRRDRMRRELLDVAARRFVAKGAENVAVEEIIEEAGIARSTFYSFFANKEQLIEDIARPFFELGIEKFQGLDECKTDELMEGILTIYLTLWHHDANALLFSQYMGRKYFPLVRDLHNRFVDQLSKLFKRLEEADLLRNDSAEHTARLVSRTVVSTLRIYSADPKFESLFKNTIRGQLLK